MSLESCDGGVQEAVGAWRRSETQPGRMGLQGGCQEEEVPFPGTCCVPVPVLGLPVCCLLGAVCGPFTHPVNNLSTGLALLSLGNALKHWR